MTNIVNTKILLSAAVILAAAAVIAGATFAFFSDTETSTGNVFTAGEIDLKIDNESYVTNNLGVLVASPETSWATTDLTTQRFFDFSDVKPGDIGEDTISIEVGSNNAWLCAAARITDDNDVDYSEPEETDDTTVNLGDPTNTDGELDAEINFSFWKDDGDNVLETDEEASIFLSGPIGGLDDEGQISLVDSAGGPLGPSPVPGGSTSYLGKAWCFGTPGAAAVAQDGQGKLPGATNGPLVRGTGVTCDGSAVDNASQTDTVVGDIQFYAVQSRNNADFSCAEDWTPEWPVQ